MLVSIKSALGIPCACCYWSSHLQHGFKYEQSYNSHSTPISFFEPLKAEYRQAFKTFMIFYFVSIIGYMIITVIFKTLTYFTLIGAFKSSCPMNKYKSFTVENENTCVS